MGGAGTGIVKALTGGMVDIEKGRVNAPFSGAAMRNSAGAAEDIGRSVGVRGLGKVASDFGKIATYGIVNLEKGRVNVPFSSAMVRDYGKGWGNVLTAGQLRSKVDAGLDTEAARHAGTAIGTIGGAVAGAGVGSALGAGAAGAGAAAGGAGGAGGSILGVSPALAGAAAGGMAAQQINSAGDAQYKITTAENAQRELEQQKANAIRAAEDARLSVQTREAEERRRRSGKQAQTVLTGFSGLGGKAPSYTQTLSPGTARKSVLG